MLSLSKALSQRVFLLLALAYLQLPEVKKTYVITNISFKVWKY